MDRNRRSVRALRDQRHHHRPNAAQGVLQTNMKAEGRNRWKMQAARGEIALDHCVARRRCSLPDGDRDLGALGIVLIRIVLDIWSLCRMRARTVRGPQPVPLVAMLLVATAYWRPVQVIRRVTAACRWPLRQTASSSTHSRAMIGAHAAITSVNGSGCLKRRGAATFHRHQCHAGVTTQPITHKLHSVSGARPRNSLASWAKIFP